MYRYRASIYEPEHTGIHPDRVSSGQLVRPAILTRPCSLVFTKQLCELCNTILQPTHGPKSSRATAARARHTVTAQFIDQGHKGAPVTKGVETSIGNPGQAYMLFPPEIGCALQAGGRLTSGSSILPQQLDRLR